SGKVESGKGESGGVGRGEGETRKRKAESGRVGRGERGKVRRGTESLPLPMPSPPLGRKRGSRQIRPNQGQSNLIKPLRFMIYEVGLTIGGWGGRRCEGRSARGQPPSPRLPPSPKSYGGTSRRAKGARCQVSEDSCSSVLSVAFCKRLPCSICVLSVARV